MILSWFILLGACDALVLYLEWDPEQLSGYDWIHALGTGCSVILNVCWSIIRLTDKAATMAHDQVLNGPDIYLVDRCCVVCLYMGALHLYRFTEIYQVNICVMFGICQMCFAVWAFGFALQQQQLVDERSVAEKELELFFNPVYRICCMGA